jgi:hypothetical protein
MLISHNNIYKIEVLDLFSKKGTIFIWQFNSKIFNQSNCSIFQIWTNQIDL